MMLSARKSGTSRNPQLILRCFSTTAISRSCSNKEELTICIQKQPFSPILAGTNRKQFKGLLSNYNFHPPNNKRDIFFITLSWKPRYHQQIYTFRKRDWHTYTSSERLTFPQTSVLSGGNLAISYSSLSHFQSLQTFPSRLLKNYLSTRRLLCDVSPLQTQSILSPLD